MTIDQYKYFFFPSCLRFYLLGYLFILGKHAVHDLIRIFAFDLQKKNAKTLTTTKRSTQREFYLKKKRRRRCVTD